MWQGQSYLAAITIGVYLVEVVAQLISEGQYIKQSKAVLDQCPASVHLLQQLKRQSCEATSNAKGNDCCRATYGHDSPANLQ